ncbi:MAG: tetratricopeptide repeat protein [Ignavibacteriales bacterium]|nr:tetratricopeptide repeat protein [Ignavibacteriales bacterium]
MSLNKIGVCNSGLRNTWFILLTLIAFLLIGCGGSEEATNETQNPQDTVKPLGTVEQEQPAEVKPMDQALTNFIGADTEKVVESPKPSIASRSQLSQYEKQIEDLRTENTSLKQKIGKLEQENRGMNARMSEAEAQSTAEKLRADKAEELAKNTSRTPQVAEEKPVSEKSAPVSGSTYDAAMKAFNVHKYDDAAKGFSAIVTSGTNSELTNRAEYWLGESYFAKKKYKEALPLFQDVLKYKNSEKKADAQFMIGQTYERLGNKAKAKEAYEKVVKNYPMSKNVKRAKARWAKL